MHLGAILTSFLTRARDTRLVWDILGPIYNRHITRALEDLYDHVASCVRLKEGGRLLDVGTGPGHTALKAAMLNPNALVTGVDFSAMQVCCARRLGRRLNVPNCRFVRADALHLPFADSTFDAATSVGSIKHWGDALQGLREMFRVVKPTGTVVVAETDKEASEADIGLFMERFTAWYVKKGIAAWGTRRIVFGQSYSEAQIVSFMEQAGFTRMHAERVPSCPYVVVEAIKP